LEALVAWLELVPESIWGAIVGALIGSGLTLLGVWLTNRQALKQQRLLFDHESKEKQRERLSNLRRDVYLPAIDAVVGMGSTLGRLVNEDPTNEEITKQAVIFGSAIARVQMVCSEKSLRLVAEVQRAYLAAQLEVQKRKFPMSLRGGKIKVMLGSRERHDAEWGRCIELMKEYNLAGISDPPRWETIQRQSEFAAKERQEASREHTRLTHEQETERLQLLRDFLQRMKGLAQIQAPALAALRAELEFTASGDVLAEEAEKTSQLAIAGIGEFIPILEAALDEMRRDAAANEAEDSA